MNTDHTNSIAPHQTSEHDKRRLAEIEASVDELEASINMLSSSSEEKLRRLRGETDEYEESVVNAERQLAGDVNEMSDELDDTLRRSLEEADNEDIDEEDILPPEEREEEGA